MPLKTVVKVGNISNLSDARYCSGMGVDMLGFCVIEGRPNYISPKLFQEIRGWISGPKVVAEIYGLASPEQLQDIIRNYAPDYFELSALEYHLHISNLSLPCIVDTTYAEADKLKSESKGIAYFLVNDINLLSDYSQAALLKIDSNTDLLIRIEHPSIAGIALNGTPELRPGYKDYSALADILEQLEE
jgi:phosphoribosylanthranilate isomerase